MGGCGLAGVCGYRNTHNTISTTEEDTSSILSLVRNKPNGTVVCLLNLHGDRLNVVTLSQRTVNDFLPITIEYQEDNFATLVVSLLTSCLAILVIEM